MAVTDTTVTDWEDDYLTSDSNSPTQTDQINAELSDQMRNIKSVVAADAAVKEWENYQFASTTTSDTDMRVYYNGGDYTGLFTAGRAIRFPHTAGTDPWTRGTTEAGWWTGWVASSTYSTTNDRTEVNLVPQYSELTGECEQIGSAGAMPSSVYWDDPFLLNFPVWELNKICPETPFNVKARVYPDNTTDYGTRQTFTYRVSGLSGNQSFVLPYPHPGAPPMDGGWDSVTGLPNVYNIKIHAPFGEPGKKLSDVNTTQLGALTTSPRAVANRTKSGTTTITAIAGANTRGPYLVNFTPGEADTNYAIIMTTTAVSATPSNHETLLRAEPVSGTQFAIYFSYLDPVVGREYTIDWAVRRTLI